MERIKAWLQKGTAALIATPVNRRYFTGFESSLGYLLVTDKKAFLLVDGRYYIDAKQRVKNAEVILLTKTSEQLLSLVKKEDVSTVFTEDILTVAEFVRIKKLLSDTEVLADDKLTEYINGLRSVKTEYEIDCITSAQRIAEKAFLEVLNFIKPGVSEKRLAVELEYRMKVLGSEKESFDTIVVSGTKSAIPHGVPDEKPIENGDFLTLDFGATVNGYHSDMTRTVAIGFATDKMRLVYETVLSAQKAAEQMVKEGVRCSDIDKAARDTIANAGFGEYFTHSTGHSLGLEIHEALSLSSSEMKVLVEGNVITNEPGIYIENEFGVRIEDMLLVTKTGSKNLTRLEKSLIIVK